MEANNVLITLPALAEKLGVSRTKVYELSRQPNFPLYNFGQRGKRVVWEEVVTWINQNIRKE
ncbi:Helix-turn-helix domain protein [compost metagenome]